MPDLPNTRLLRSALSGELDQDVQTFKTIFNSPQNEDVIFRRFQAAGFSMCLIYLEGMASANQIADFILRATMESDGRIPESSGQGVQFLMENVLNIPQASAWETVEKLVEGILGGMSALLVDGCREACLLETRGFEKRSVGKTQSESVVSGSQEGFVESLRTNITLLRRYVQSPQLITEKSAVGTKVRKDIALLYLTGVVREKSLEEIRRRIQKIQSASVQSLGQLQQHIEDCPFAILPQMMLTERPDRAASCLLDGQIVILMDNSPYALVAPATVFHLLHASDDSFQRWQYGTFLRLIRFIGILFSALLPGFYVAVTLFHPHLIPTALLTAIAESRANVPFTILTEVLIMEISYDLINEASMRIPSQIGSAIGIVGGLILGQAAVSASIISPIVIIVIALTGLGNFVIPNYGFTIGVMIYRLILIFAGALMGLYGLVLATFLILCHLCSMRSLGVPFLSPISPYRRHNPDIVLRFPVWLQKRLLFLARHKSWMHTEGDDEP